MFEAMIASFNGDETLAPGDFAENAAHFLAELNAIHAFREGNGRSQLASFDMLVTCYVGWLGLTVWICV